MSYFGKIWNSFDTKRKHWSARGMLEIQLYRGYGNDERFFIKGRVLRKKRHKASENQSVLRNIANSFARFETDEVPFVELELTILGNKYPVKTEREGYFSLETKWESLPENRPEEIAVSAVFREEVFQRRTAKPAEGFIFLPDYKAEFAIVTDVDDTVLQTYAYAPFRMLWATFFQNAAQRKPMEGMVELFQKMESGAAGKPKNPVFYVSHSPWNLYHKLATFFQLQNLPKGPILLRDYGLLPSGAYQRHKVDSISHLMEMYPYLPFVLFGDTAAKDTDFYLELSKKYPNRIKAIYIRKTWDTRNARRVAQLIEQQSNADVVLVDSAAQMVEHAKRVGLIH